MELKRLISHFTYRIELKPGGGFIAQPSDPSVAPLVAHFSQTGKLSKKDVAELKRLIEGLDDDA